MRIAVLLMIGCLSSLAAPGEASTAQKKVHHSKKQPSKSAKVSITKAKTPGKHAKTAGKRGKTKSAANWRSRQLAPTADRYKEIQSALVQRGYLNQSANGVWDGASSDALRRFQQDQNLEPSGKLNSLSLIALGLGAKRGPAVAGIATPPPAITPRVPLIDTPPPLPQNTVPQAPPPNLAVPELPSPPGVSR